MSAAAAAAAIVFPVNGICFPNTFSKSPNLLRTAITDNALLKSRSVHSPDWSIRCEGNRKGRPRRDAASGGTGKGNSHQSSDGETPNSAKQEEILALFRRIQSSIAKDGGSATIRKRRSERSENQKGRKSAESVLDVLRKSRNQLKENKELPSTQDFTLTRPPSKFMKKSPIPGASIMKEHVVEVDSEESEATNEGHYIEAMKLTELKELAKSKGMKGYSKLKKAELVELLKRSQV